jgi:GT2 family glycosyltransferase
MNRTATIQIQSVLYGNSTESVVRSAKFLQQSVCIAQQRGLVSRAHLAYGDCSPRPIFEQGVQLLAEELLPALSIGYEYFDANLGTAAGHNRLAGENQPDFFLIMNPDVLPSPRCLANLLNTALGNPKVGVVEAKQLPLEHPKDFDPVTGRTSWASTACALFRRDAFDKAGRFDAQSFFLYCDDVDMSWSIRQIGYDVVYCADAFVFHDKRLSTSAKWCPTSAERYYSAEAALLLAHKWSRPDVLEALKNDFSASEEPEYQKALNEFQVRQAEGRLPTPIDGSNEIAEFIGGNYASHRYAL